MRILVVGPYGQDARCIISQLAELPRMEVFGVTPENRVPKSDFSQSHLAKVKIFSADLADIHECNELLDKIQPDIVFHLAAIHGSSNTMEHIERELTREMWKCHVGITENIIRWQRCNSESKFVYAGSSQMFLGKPPGHRISETSAPFPTNEYGKSKLAGWDLVKEAREKYNLHSSCAILFNHTSEYSKPDFLFPELVQKISHLKKTNAKTFTVKHPNAHVDISLAQEVSEGLIRLSAQSNASDYVFGSGKSKTISSILRSAFETVGIDGVSITGKSYQEQLCLVSNPMKAKTELGWEAGVSPEEVLIRMIRFADQDGLSNHS